MREDLPWTSTGLVVADVEGNGRRPPNLVEAAVVPIVDGRIGEPASWLVRPPEPIGWQATRVHGITNQEVAELPGWQPAAVVDTLKLARVRLPGRPSYRLVALVDAFDLARDLPNGLRPHRAAYDALVTARLFVHLATDADGGPLPLGELAGTPAAAPQPDQLF